MATKKQAPQPAPIADPVPPADPRATMLAFLSAGIEGGNRRVADLAKRLTEGTENPLAALEWSAQTFGHAAIVSVYGEIHRALSAPESKATVESVRDYAMRQMTTGAKYPPSSTSVTSNLAKQCATAAWAEVYEFARDIL